MKLSAKLFGWILLLSGVAVISWAMISSYNIFTAKTDVPHFFQEERVTLDLLMDEEDGEKATGEQIEDLLPSGSILALLNLSVWSILAGIMIFGGSNIAGIGIKLIKEK